MADKQINPNLRKLAELTYNPSLELPNLEEVKEQPQTSAPELKGMIYVPSINLYVAKQRDLNGLTWNQTIDKIYNQGIKVAGQKAEMPTPFEFMSYVNYLLLGSVPNLKDTERTEILNDILKTGDYRRNWLNAKFVKHGKGFNGLGIETATFDSVGKLVKKTTPLEKCLWQDEWAGITSANDQGLFTKKSSNQNYEQGKNAYFWYPREGCVARFDADSVGALLYCYGYPDYSGSSLGVRVVVRPKGVSPKI